MFGNILRDRQPSSVVFIAAIAVLARTVPVFLAPSFGYSGAFCFVMLDNTGDIIAFCRLLIFTEKINLLQHYGLERMSKVGKGIAEPYRLANPPRRRVGAVGLVGALTPRAAAPRHARFARFVAAVARRASSNRPGFRI